MRISLHKLLIAAALGAAALTAVNGCAYRADLAQGNFVEQSDVDKLRYGMTADQVRYLLGTPMLVDPYDATRWYYVRYLRQGWNDPEIHNLICIFQGRILVDIQGDFKKPESFNAGAGSISKIGL